MWRSPASSTTRLVLSRRCLGRVRGLRATSACHLVARVARLVPNEIARSAESVPAGASDSRHGASCGVCRAGRRHSDQRQRRKRDSLRVTLTRRPSGHCRQRRSAASASPWSLADLPRPPIKDCFSPTTIRSVNASSEGIQGHRRTARRYLVQIPLLQRCIRSGLASLSSMSTELPGTSWSRFPGSRPS